LLLPVQVVLHHKLKLCEERRGDKRGERSGKYKLVGRKELIQEGEGKIRGLRSGWKK